MCVLARDLARSWAPSSYSMQGEPLFFLSAPLFTNHCLPWYNRGKQVAIEKLSVAKSGRKAKLQFVVAEEGDNIPTNAKVTISCGALLKVILSRLSTALPLSPLRCLTIGLSRSHVFRRCTFMLRCLIPRPLATQASSMYLPAPNVTISHLCESKTHHWRSSPSA